MAYTLSGTLKLPDGTAAAGVDLRFVALTTFSPLIESAEQTVRTAANGSYNIALEISSYNVFVTYGNNRPFLAGRIVINSNTAPGQDLPTLLGGIYQPTTPEWIQQVEAWLTEAKDSAARAQQYAVTASNEANRAEQEADRASLISGLDTVQEAVKIAILDYERYSLERATGGRQTIIRDKLGNANAMFVLPRFRYDDLGMAADMGSGDVTAFDFGSGSIKSEIFIGVYLASGEGAISAPRAVPRTYVEQSTARAACAGKGVGWHLMTAHEWAAVALWCMANGYEPIGNTGWGRSHEKTWLVGDRLDNLSPGDTAGEARTLAGSLGAEATHDRIGGISDMVGNVWEWQDGFLLRSGQVIASTHNAQPQAEWSPQAAYFDNHNSTPMLSDSVTRTASANVEWRALGKGANYVSNQLLKRLMVEPSTVLPKGKLIVNNEGEQLPIRGGAWSSTTDAGLAAIGLFIPQATTNPYVGFRPAFA